MFTPPVLEGTTSIKTLYDDVTKSYLITYHYRSGNNYYTRNLILDSKTLNAQVVPGPRADYYFFGLIGKKSTSGNTITVDYYYAETGEWLTNVSWTKGSASRVPSLGEQSPYSGFYYAKLPWLNSNPAEYYVLSVELEEMPLRVRDSTPLNISPPIKVDNEYLYCFRTGNKDNPCRIRRYPLEGSNSESVTFYNYDLISKQTINETSLGMLTSLSNGMVYLGVDYIGNIGMMASSACYDKYGNYEIGRAHV